MSLDGQDFERLGEVRDACRATAKNTEQIVKALQAGNETTRALVEEIRSLSDQLTRRIDLIEEAIADPKSDAAKTLHDKYKHPAPSPGGQKLKLK